MASYRAVLNQQIEEKREREEREMEDKERFIRKIESEAAVYDPWGKPGAGAPCWILLVMSSPREGRCPRVSIKAVHD